MRRAAMLAGLFATLALRGATADTIIVSTGLDPSNNLIMSGGQNDAHWTVTEQGGGTGAAQTVFSNNADFDPGYWAANGPNSDWIARNANSSIQGPSLITAFTTFDLTGYDISTATLSGAWAIDDAGTLSLNGHDIASLNTGYAGSLTSFSVPNAYFVQGVNTLTITETYNYGNGYLDAVRLEGDVTANPSPTAVPEPNTLSLAATAAVVGLISVRRRRRCIR